MGGLVADCNVEELYTENVIFIDSFDRSETFNSEYMNLKM